MLVNLLIGGRVLSAFARRKNSTVRFLLHQLASENPVPSHMGSLSQRVICRSGGNASQRPQKLVFWHCTLGRGRREGVWLEKRTPRALPELRLRKPSLAHWCGLSSLGLQARRGLKTWAQALVPHPPRASPPGDTRPCTAGGGGLHGAGGRSGSSSQGKSSDGAAMEWQERSQQSRRPWTKSEEPSGAQGRWRSRSCDREGGRVLPPTSKDALLSGRLRLCLGKQ